jgi:DNA-binding transcriptional regulator LsrR (DeoR family)
LYYEDHLSQIEIAGKLSVTRQEVAAMLREAEIRKIVDIRISVPEIHQRKVMHERKLSRHYGVEFVVASGIGGLTIIDEVSSFMRRAPVSYNNISVAAGNTIWFALSECVKDAATMNRADRETLQREITKLYSHGRYIFPATGLIPRRRANINSSSFENAQLMLDYLLNLFDPSGNGDWAEIADLIELPLPADLSIAEREYLNSSRVLGRYRRLAERADLVVAEITSPDSEMLRPSGFDVSLPEVPDAVGTIAGYFYDQDGNPVANPAVQPLGIGLETIRRVAQEGADATTKRPRKVVAVADRSALTRDGVGINISPVKAAVQANLCNLVIIGEALAEAMIANIDDEPGTTKH